MGIAVIDFDSSIIWFDCEHCRGNFGQFPGGSCEGCSNTNQWPLYLGTLLANLAIAGALCAAFKLGRAHGVDEAATQVGMWPSANPWQPNTAGRAVPGKGK